MQSDLGQGLKLPDCITWSTGPPRSAQRLGSPSLGSSSRGWMLGRPQREGMPVLGEGLGPAAPLVSLLGFLELCWDSGAPGLVLRVQRASRDSSCGKKRRARPGWSGLNGESQGGTGCAVTVNWELAGGLPPILPGMGEARGARGFAGVVTRAGGCLFLGLSFTLSKSCPRIPRVRARGEQVPTPRCLPAVLPAPRG